MYLLVERKRTDINLRLCQLDQSKIDKYQVLRRENVKYLVLVTELIK